MTARNIDLPIEYFAEVVGSGAEKLLVKREGLALRTYQKRDRFSPEGPASFLVGDWKHLIRHNLLCGEFVSFGGGRHLHCCTVMTDGGKSIK